MIAKRLTGSPSLEQLQSETDFQAKIVEWAKICGWMIYHPLPARNSRGRWATHQVGDPGFPDLVLARDGRLIFWEVKTERGRMSIAQNRWRIVLQSCTHTHERPRINYQVVRPSDWSWIEEFLR